MKNYTLTLFSFFYALTINAQAPKKVMVEEFTGIWCGFCPKAKTALEDCMNTYPNTVGVAIHNSDVLANTYTNTIANGFNISSYPNGAVDRYPFSTDDVTVPYSIWKLRAASRLNTPTSVAVSYTSTFNSTTRVLNVTVTANFVNNDTGNIRINCLVVEDNVIKSSNPQTNYYGNGCSSPEPNIVWYNYPCYIPNYVHNHVARINLANDVWGTAGVIPSSITAGQTFTQNYTYTIPSTWDANNLHLVPFISRFGPNMGDREIMNTGFGPLVNSSTSIEDNFNVQQLELSQNKPNPFTELTAIQFKLNAADNVVVKVYDMFGKEINVLTNMKLIAGEHTFYWAGTDVNGNTVAPGVYYYSISTSKEIVSKPMVYLGVK